MRRMKRTLALVRDIIREEISLRALGLFVRIASDEELKHAFHELGTHLRKQSIGGRAYVARGRTGPLIVPR